MSREKINKIIKIALVLILALAIFPTASYATSSDEWMSQGEDFINRGKQNSTIDTSNIKDTLMPIGRTLVTIATIVITAVTVVMAIKYMMCDTADKKAKLKTQLIGLVVSTIVIYGAQVIWALVLNFMTEAFG